MFGGGRGPRAAASAPAPGPPCALQSDTSAPRPRATGPRQICPACRRVPSEPPPPAWRSDPSS